MIRQEGPPQQGPFEDQEETLKATQEAVEEDFPMAEEEDHREEDTQEEATKIGRASCRERVSSPV